jgi:hypothetical protein
VLIDEHPVSCPYCGEPIQLELDLSVAEQTYVEDCPVCCQPMLVHYAVDELGIAQLNVRAESE